MEWYHCPLQRTLEALDVDVAELIDRYHLSFLPAKDSDGGPNEPPYGQSENTDDEVQHVIWAMPFDEYGLEVALRFDPASRGNLPLEGARKQLLPLVTRLLARGFHNHVITIPASIRSVMLGGSNDHIIGMRAPGRLRST